MMRNHVAKPKIRHPAAWQITPAELVENFLDRRSKNTRRAYAADLADFAKWLHVDSPAEAIALLVWGRQAHANDLVLRYMARLRRAGSSPATANRHLAAIKSIVNLGRMLGVCDFAIDVRRQKDQPYRDTRGPAVEKIRAIIADLDGRARRGEVKATRDLAIVRLLFNRALRRAEVVGVDGEHYDEHGRRLAILGKGKTRRVCLTLSAKTCEALSRWMRLRWPNPRGGRRMGPIFVACRKRALKSDGKRLCGRDVSRILRAYGVAPQGLRHAAITAALEATHGNIAMVQRFARHASPATTMIYEDRREDAGRKVATALDGMV